MTSIISISGVSKTYAPAFKALDHVDLEIQRGEIFALLGPNGAGKTTLIGLICGIVRPGEGSARSMDSTSSVITARSARRSAWCPRN